MAIVEIFKQLNYEIDVVPCYTPAFDRYHLKKKYDVIFGFGPNYIRACRSNPRAKKIIYLTESSPDFSLNQEKKRIEDFYKRTGEKISIARSGLYLTNEDIQISEYGILVGNQVTLNSYNHYNKKILTIPVTGLLNSEFRKSEITPNLSSKAFLWLGSHGAIHKGLDLCIEAFKKLPEMTLYVAGVDKKESWLIKNLPPNIKSLGFINIQSKQFLELRSKCRFKILPSCSEGMSTSVITAMNHAIIPIVTKETGIDLDFPELYLESCEIGDIISKAKFISSLPEARLKEIEDSVYNYAQKTYSVENFKRCLQKALSSLINED